MSQTADQKAAAEQEAAEKKTATEKKAADEKAAKAKETKPVKVKFLRSHPAFAYFAGDEGEISAEAYEKYSKDGEFFEKL